ncbi:MAG: ABC transporter permease [Hyphomicrobiales bacterium]|jgi:putative hydroxymethylpyrimidine transport system permease protein|nr:ABC transporter permease [Hyphomicrobiales bacterium]|tara:strand:- start:1169 stop:1903 length:735 start_codon:yes stop_codon:yes gene_type:complete
MRSWYYPLASISSIILIWQMGVWISSAPSYILPAPVDVILSFIDNWQLILEHTIVTVTEVLLGLFFGISLGFITALYLETSKKAVLFLRPVLIFSQAIPVFALAPLLTLWLGYGIISKVVMAILIIYFPVTSSFYDGLTKTPRSFLDLAQTMGSTKSRILYYIKIPAAIPSLFTGIRLAAVYAPIGATIGEWVGSSQGLGYLMLLANGRVKIDLMFASLLTLGFISIGLYGIVSFILNKISSHY